MLRRNPGEQLTLVPFFKDNFYVNGVLLTFKFDKNISLLASVDRAKNIVFMKQ